MAAYTAVVSLMNTIEQIEHNPGCPISLEKEQVESLRESINFLLDFLEGYSHVADDLDSRIADAAYAAEDLVESHIVDQILAGSKRHGEEISSHEELRATEEISSDEELRAGKEADGLDSHIADAAYAVEDVIKSHILDQSLAGSKRHGEEISSHKELRATEEISSDQELGAGKEADGLDSRIADAAYAGEDVIKSHIDQIAGALIKSLIVDEIVGGSTSQGEKASSIDFYEGLQKVIEDMDSIKKEVMQFKEKMGVQDKLQRNSTPAAGSFRSSSTGQNTMVGFDDDLHEIMDMLTGQPSGLQIIPIMGMGGIGKTTLAKNVYAKPLIKEHFDICAWAIFSQGYNTREILREVLCQVNKDSKGGSIEMSENELGEKLYKHLLGRRYLIVVDDLWSIEAWDKIKFFFPDYSNGSRIVVTTRLSNLASQLNDSYSLGMDFLDEDSSRDLFFKIVFEEECCPVELEEIGKKIVKNCKGLPLSIVVIGGLLAKSERTREYWESTLENLNSIVNLEENEGGLQILYMSYNNLPVHLKPCFLYMGVFKGGSKIRVSKLIKLWSMEGFVRPLDDRSLQKAAEEYLQELVDRNLILVEECNYNGKLKFCKIHDLLRDLCLREAQKVKFFCFLGEQSTLNIPQNINTERRICIHKTTLREKNQPKVFHVLSVARSLIWQHRRLDFSSFFSRLLRVYIGEYSGVHIFQQVNLRYVSLRVSRGGLFYSFSNFHFPLWNLQSLILEGFQGMIIVEIWKMPQLRYVKVDYIQLLDPPADDIVILKNLQALAVIKDFKCDEEVVKRIPNIKKLKVRYWSESPDNHCINNLGHLKTLESLDIFFDGGLSHLLQNLTIPQNLKKLTLEGDVDCNWEDTLEKIGSLPLLEKLILICGTFKGGKWETVEGQFPSLKYLVIESCDLEYWMAESSHFPILVNLDLEKLQKLKEIPLEIGEIPTLQSIQIFNSSDSVVQSAKKILQEQKELYGEVSLNLILDGKIVSDIDEDGFVFSEYEDEDDDEDVDEDEDEDEDKKRTPDSFTYE